MTTKEQPSGSCQPNEEPSTKSVTGTTPCSDVLRQIKQETLSSNLPAAVAPATVWAFGMPSTDLERVIDRMVLSTDKDESQLGAHLQSMLAKHNGEIEEAADLSQDEELSQLYQLNTQARTRVKDAREVGDRLRDTLKTLTERYSDVTGVTISAVDALKTAQSALTDVGKMMDELDQIEAALAEDDNGASRAANEEGKSQ